MNLKKSLGIILIILGIFIIIAQPFSMTGAVIDISSSLSKIWFFVGLGLIGVGVVLMAKVGGLEIKVFKMQGKGRKDKETQYAISDPKQDFGNLGFVTLNDFRNEIREYRQDQELYDKIKRTFEPGLTYIKKEGSEIESEIADEFLKVLLQGVQEPEEQKEYITKNEKEEILNPFKKGWKTSPDNSQR